MLRWLYHVRKTTTDGVWPYAPPSLANEGFIHASFRDDVVASAELYFPRDASLEVLAVDPRKLTARVDIASTPRGPMPHIAGPIDRGAVAQVISLADFAAATRADRVTPATDELTPLARALHAHVEDSRRVDRYYLPLALGCEARLERCQHRPWVLGIQGPQGAGKTTLATALTAAFGELGQAAVSVSIDDFYLTAAQQRALAERHPGNRTMEHRGYPGTHDVGLGSEVIRALKKLGAGHETTVPVYDKSMHGGRGDRAPSGSFRRVRGPVDILIVEGWMLGFSPVDSASLEPDLEVANEYLAAYGAWHRELDAFVHLAAPSLETIVEWRVDAERAKRARGEQGLADDDARDYIERFLPAYRAYVPRLVTNPPCADFQRILLGEDRLPA